MPIPTYIWKKVEDGLKLIDFNDVADKIVNGKMNEFLGIKATEMYKDQPSIIKDLNQCLNDKSCISKELKYRYKSLDEVRKLKATYDFIPPDMVMVHTEDLTKQKSAEQKLIESEKKYTQLRLKKSEERYRNLVNNINDIIYELDEKGRIIYVSPQIHKITGYYPEELMDHDELDSIHPEDIDKVIKTMERELSADEKYSLEFRRLHKNGHYISLYTKGRRITIDGKSKIIGVTRDITKRKEAELKLQESEEKFSKAFHSSPTLMAITRMADGRIIDVNNAFTHTLGYNCEELIGRTTIELDLWVNTKEREKFTKMLKEDGKINPFDVDVYTKSGKIITTLFSGEIIHLNNEPHLITIASDITERRKTEQELIKKNIELSVLNRIITLGNESQSLQEFLEKSYDQVLDVVGFDRGGIYLYNAKTQRNILVLNKNVHPDFIAAVEDVDMSEGLFRRVFDEYKPFYIEDFSKFMEGSKELGIYSVAIIPLRSKDEYVGSLNIGSPVYQVLTSNELELLVAIGKQMGIVIQKFKSEKLLKESEEKYREAYNRSELYKDIFTHDINNMLQNILSSVELSKLYSKDHTKEQEYEKVTDLITEEVIRGRYLVTNVQVLSEVDELEIPLSQIEPLIILKKAIEFVKGNFLYKVINIEMDSFQNEYFISGNILLTNIFENVLINAVKHNINPIIEIVIRISNISKDGTNFIKFEFLDNGIGIPDSMKKEIFSREYKKIEKNKVPSGIGLGILLIRRILDNYNGEIVVEDRFQGDYSMGSNFIILIPEAK